DRGHRPGRLGRAVADGARPHRPHAALGPALADTDLLVRPPIRGAAAALPRPVDERGALDLDAGDALRVAGAVPLLFVRRTALPGADRGRARAAAERAQALLARLRRRRAPDRPRPPLRRLRRGGRSGAAAAHPALSREGDAALRLRLG